jgi:uncharacterized protein (DUF427 family)
MRENGTIGSYGRDPNHRIDIRPGSREVRVILAGVTICASRLSQVLSETGLPPRYYVPRDDVRMDLLTPSATTSFCPYKGDAVYWSIRVGERCAEDAVWSYPDPLPGCERIKGLLCFYPERVDELRVEG